MTDRKTNGKTRVAIVYHYLPHYRKGVFEELMQSEELDPVFVAAEKAPASMGIKLWKCPDPKRFIPTKRYTVYLGKTSNGGFPRYLAWQSGLIRLAFRRDIDAFVYLGDMYTVSLWISVVIARWRKKPVHIWAIGWRRDERGLKGRLRCFLYGLGDTLLLYGHFAKNHAVKRGFAPERVHVVYNSLDYLRQKEAREAVAMEELAAIRSELFSNPERPLLTCCSRLQPYKRLDLLMNAAARLQDTGCTCNVLLIGDGPERDKLQRQAECLRVSVKFYGACYEEKTLVRLIMASDISVVPGMVGLTAIQSLAYGTPLITHGDSHKQSPEWEAIVPNETGAMFEYGSAESLACVIRTWLSNNPDRDAVQKRCYDIIERYFNPQKQCEIIERAIAGKPAIEDPYWKNKFGA